MTTDTINQAARIFEAYTEGNQFVIRELDPSTVLICPPLDRQTAWDRARGQGKPIVLIDLDGVEHPIAPDAAPAEIEITDGWFMLGEDVIKIQHNRAHTHFYAKRLVVEDGHGTWVHEPGLIKNMRGAKKMTQEAAAQFGKLYGVCFRCAAELTDENSISRGYGPICAGKMGWQYASSVAFKYGEGG